MLITPVMFSWVLNSRRWTFFFWLLHYTLTDVTTFIHTLEAASIGSIRSVGALCLTSEQLSAFHGRDSVYGPMDLTVGRKEGTLSPSSVSPGFPAYFSPVECRVSTLTPYRTYMFLSSSTPDFSEPVRNLPTPKFTTTNRGFTSV